MINALQQAQIEESDRKKIRQAYWVSVCLPPLGLFIAAYYALSDKPDGKHVALNCVIFTLVALLVAWGVGALMLASLTPGQTSQMQNIDVNALKNALQQQ